MKILGIDYGEKRIGLAISDETATFARELEILSPKQFWEQINDIINRQGIERIVVGLPLNMSGQDTLKTTETKDFVDRLHTKTNMQVELMDERLSSVMATNISGQTKNLDSLAAQIILQNFLDKRKSDNISE